MKRSLLVSFAVGCLLFVGCTKRSGTEIVEPSEKHPDSRPDATNPTPDSEVPWLVDPDNAGPNLPPNKTRSLFDFLIDVGPNGNPRKAIFPYTELQKLLASNLRPVAADANSLFENSLPLLGTLIPFSRSVQRAYSNYESPRALFSTEQSPLQTANRLGFDLRHRIFVGYAKDAGELEVISYNEGAGRIEFQQVLDYRPGRTPRVVYASRFLCVTCHKNQAPFFPEGSWSETHANPIVVDRMKDWRIKNRQPLVTFFEGIRMAPPGGTDDFTRKFDESTDRSNFLMPTQRAWREWCGANEASGYICRGRLTQLAFRTYFTGDVVIDTDPIYRSYGDLVRKAWKENKIIGFKIPYFNLRNRDPFTDKKGQNREEAGVNETKVAGRQLDKQRLEDILKRVKLAPEFEPARNLSHVPPKVGEPAFEKMVWNDVDRDPFRLATSLLDFFTDADIALIRSAATNDDRIYDALDQMALKKDRALSNLPFQRREMVCGLLHALQPDDSKKPTDCQLDPTQLGAPVVARDGDGLHNVTLGKDIRVAPFVDYCASCHIPMKFPIDFSKMKDDEEVIQVFKIPRVNDKIRYMLTWEEKPAEDDPLWPMPRRNSESYNLLKADEEEAKRADPPRKSIRQQMLDTLKELKAK